MMWYKKHKLSAAWVGAAAVLLLGGCSMAPKYERPQVWTEPEWAYAQTDGNAVQAASLGWQDYFADARLQALIRLAVQNNRDLRTAALNVEAVRAQYAISVADRLPGVNASGQGSKARVAQDLSSTGRSYIGEQYSVGLGVAAFELDLFGRVKSLSDSALRQYLASAEARDAAHISLVAQVAKAYFAERTADEAMQLSQRVLATREQSQKLAQLKFKAGVISAIDLRQAESQIEAAKADYAAQTRNREQARNALALLIGQPVPADLPAAAPLNRQFKQAQLPAGLPSEVLTSRPDVRQAEYTLQAANAQIGAARAAFFPRISLTGSIGSGSTELSQLFSGGNGTWSFMPQISVPIFNWGANKANLDLTHARKNIAVAQYEQTVQAAFRDVADALVAQATLSQQLQAQQRSQKAESERYRLINMRFKYGISSSLELLDAQRQSYAADLAVLQTRLLLLNNRADVYKVLGGGLHADTRQSTVVAAP